MLAEYLSVNIFAFLLVFARLGAAFMVVPGFGEAFIPPRVRLAVALGVSFIVLPFAIDQLPGEPATPIELLLLLVGEMVIGLVMGGILRLLLSSLHIAGTIIAQQSGLAAAQFFDPAQMTQGAITSTFMTLMGLTMIFVTDMHHLFIEGTFATYRLFPAGQVPDFGSISQLITDFVQQSFLLGFQMSAPFLVFGITFYMGIGLINRLMPQVQIFFVAMPLQIVLSFAILAITIGAAMMWFISYYEEALMRFLGE
ncbi:flagellar type III secretion system protein FliR [Sneathiella chungangensis]|uniref:Flagellar biosynthetic protein FliR n=1 Tax=Sneathiella chungangensis TaxID=1418234 RepID=A0A845MCN7_9PROT|nr:flagellar biosynthetic protein FliR [Sneathiella chungangensis]MZR21110.1 flagellar type III secretion system protein FliR [Sneathiella chungangensis]